MRFSVSVAAWSLLYGLAQLAVLCCAVFTAVVVAGTVVAGLASLAARIAPPVADRDLDVQFDRAVAALDRNWNDSMPTGQDLAAERLESAAAEMGIQLAPAEAPDRPRPTQQSSDVFAAVSYELLAICRLEPAVVDLASLPRYEVWRRYQRNRLDEAMATLVEGDPPHWAPDPARLQDVRAADLVGQLWLQRVLVAEAAIAATEGDVQAAARALEASWRLGNWLRASPQMSTLETATAVLELQLAAIRRCRIPDGPWPTRLSSIDPRGDALALYAVRMDQTRQRALNQLSVQPRFFGLVARPLARLLMVQQHHAALMAVSRLESEPITAFDADRFAARVVESVPRWNTLARETLPTSWSWWFDSVYAALEVELTEQALEVRRADWTSELADLDAMEASRASRIVGVTWQRRLDDGVLSITADPELPPPGGGFPLRETVRVDSRRARPR